MEAAKAKRTTAKSGFTRYEKRLKAVLELDEADEWTLKTRYDDLKVRWERVQETHDEYTTHLTETEGGNAAEQWMEEIMERFDQIELAVGEKLKKLSAVPKVLLPPNDATTNSLSPPTSTKGIVKMDKFKFQAFAGDIKKYPEFKTEFIEHVQSQYDESQHAFVLKQYLSESVRAEASNVLDDYKKMWERLDQKYGNTGKLVDAILADVKRISLRDSSNANVLQMINVVEKANRDLERLGEHAELRNSTSISIIEQAMTREMKHEWVKLIASKPCTSSQKFNLLLAFLEDWRNRLEYMGASIRDISEDCDAAGATFHSGQGERQNLVKTRCWLHKLDGEAGAHPIWKCKVFLGKSRPERRQLVVANKACMRCLVTECAGAQEVSQCVRKFNCLVCEGPHNSRLHVDAGATFHANESGEGTATSAILPTQEI